MTKLISEISRHEDEPLPTYMMEGEDPTGPESVWFTIQEMLQSETVAEIMAQHFSADNMLMNPIGELNQRGRTTIADGEYYVDRWICIRDGGHTDIGGRAAVTGQWTNTGETANSNRIRMSTSGRYGIGGFQMDASAVRCGAYQIVQVSDVQNRRGEYVTVSGSLFQNSGSTKNAVVFLLEWTGNGDDMPKDPINDWTSTNFTAGNFFKSTTTNVLAAQTIAVPSGVDTPIDNFASLLSVQAINLGFGFAFYDTLAQDTAFAGRFMMNPGRLAVPFKKRPHMLEYAACRQFWQASTLYSVAPADGCGTGGALTYVAQNTTTPPNIRHSLTPVFVTGSWRDWNLYNPRTGAGGADARFDNGSTFLSTNPIFGEANHANFVVHNQGGAATATGPWRIHFMGTVDPGTTHVGTGL